MPRKADTEHQRVEREQKAPVRKRRALCASLRHSDMGSFGVLWQSERPRSGPGPTTGVHKVRFGIPHGFLWRLDGHRANTPHRPAGPRTLRGVWSYASVRLGGEGNEVRLGTHQEPSAAPALPRIRTMALWVQDSEPPCWQRSRLESGSDTPRTLGPVDGQGVRLSHTCK